MTKKAILVDLDGTLCDSSWRLYHIQKTPEHPKKDWGEFFRGIPQDNQVPHVAGVVETAFESGYHVIFFTARPENTRKWTLDWLEARGFLRENSLLLMRSNNDHREDVLVKEEMLTNHVLPNYTVMFAIDDNEKILQMYDKMQITSFHPDHFNMSNK